MLNRRSMLLSGGAALAAGGLSTQLSALQLGQATLTTVSDGSLVLPGEFIFGPMPQDELGGVLSKAGVSATRLEPECNLALYQDGTNTVLFDVGSGQDFAPTAGTILDSLDAVGLTPGDITHVLFTHAHPDHLWGLLDDFDEPLFYDATYMMGRAEWDYWWNPETVNTIGTARATFAVGAKRRMEVIEDQVVLFDDGDEVLPGIAALATPGHTPGHMGFEVRSGSQAALIVGDSISNDHVALLRPKWRSGSDQDTDTAIVSRMMLLDRLTHEDLSVVGFHISNGGMGRITASGDEFTFEATT